MMRVPGPATRAATKPSHTSSPRRATCSHRQNPDTATSAPADGKNGPYPDSVGLEAPLPFQRMDDLLRTFKFAKAGKSGQGCPGPLAQHRWQESKRENAMLATYTNVRVGGTKRDVDMFRSAKVRAVRRQLAAGRYDREEIIEATIDRILGSAPRPQRQGRSSSHNVSGA